MNLLDRLYNFGDQLQSMWNNPETIIAQLQSDHVLLVEVIAVIFVILFLLYILLKPSPKPKSEKVEQQQEATPTVQKATRSSNKSNKKEPALVVPVRHTSVMGAAKAVFDEGRLQEMQAKQKQRKEDLDPPEDTHLQELSDEEEQALAQAIVEAGQKALAEVAGEPHQAEFFESQDVAEEAVKKMFAGAREEQKPELEVEETLIEEVVAPEPIPQAIKKVAPKMDFLILYYMAPRSQAYPVVDLFKLFDSFSLNFNSDNVFEFVDQGAVQFYVASALKPGAFVLDPQAQVPGLSFILDLNKVENGKAAFGKMLKFIDDLTHYMKGDVLDERRQRMTTATMNEYLARIKSFQRI